MNFYVSQGSDPLYLPDLPTYWNGNHISIVTYKQRALYELFGYSIHEPQPLYAYVCAQNIADVINSERANLARHQTILCGKINLDRQR